MGFAMRNGGSLSSKWNDACRLAAALNCPDHAFRDWRAVERLELEVLCGEILTTHDALAKLSAVALAFEDGPRTDGADAAALRQTIDWLSAVVSERSAA